MHAAEALCYELSTPAHSTFSNFCNERRLAFPKSVMPAKAGIQGGEHHKMRPCIYVLASDRNSTLYVGVTSNIDQRVWAHKTDAVDGFTKRYGVHRLVYLEFHETMQSAIAREKQLKKWRRAWKLQLIEAANPQWPGLYDDIQK
jgi:putative endonuclease